MNRSTEGLASRLETCYRQDFIKPFPNDDCYKIGKTNRALSRGLEPDLDWYCSFIAGYASSATTLSKRPIAELHGAIPRLKKSFWQANPRYEFLATLVTATDTPALFKKLRVADELRAGLIELMEPLVASSPGV